MKNEPVAWMHKESGQVFAGMGSPIESNDFIPLYTHPAKTLTDDAQYDRGFDAGYKHAEKNLQAEIEALKAKTLNNQKMIDVLMELAKYRLLTADEIEELAILRKAQKK